MKISVSQDILKAIRLFGGIYRLHVQVRSISFVVNQPETGRKQICLGTTQCNIPEDRTLHRYRDEEQKSKYFIRFHESNKVKHIFLFKLSQYKVN